MALPLDLPRWGGFLVAGLTLLPFAAGALLAATGAALEAVDLTAGLAGSV